MHVSFSNTVALFDNQPQQLIGLISIPFSFSHFIRLCYIC